MIIFVGLLCAAWAGCVIFHGPAESAFRVKAKIVKSNPADPSECLLQLYRAGEDKPIREVGVSREFVESFTIAPGFHKYYMVITCPDSPGRFNSRVYELGGSRYHAQPLDLGTIDLTSPVSKPEMHPNAHKSGKDAR
jgi:hypothetical protein